MPSWPHCASRFEVSASSILMATARNLRVYLALHPQ
jgi:hypothetical protein